jgi:polyisoprenoid-binding protein YceI
MNKPTILFAPGGLVALVLAGLLATAADAGAQPVTPPLKLKIDAEHSTVAFKVRHLFTKVNGQFRSFEGTVDFHQTDATKSRLMVTIQAGSIDTNVAARDTDLKSARFFDVAKFPTLTFISTIVTYTAPNRATIRGVLTMHGVSKEVALDTEFLGAGKDPWGNLRYSFHAEGKLNRKDFGMVWNQVIEAGGVMVGEEVEIMLDIEAVPAPAPAS